MSATREWVGEIGRSILALACLVVLLLAGVKLGYDMGIEDGIIQGTNSQETVWENSVIEQGLAERVNGNFQWKDRHTLSQEYLKTTEAPLWQGGLNLKAECCPDGKCPIPDEKENDGKDKDNSD